LNLHVNVMARQIMSELFSILGKFIRDGGEEYSYRRRHGEPDKLDRNGNSNLTV
jgi:hypothetical protein